MPPPSPAPPLLYGNAVIGLTASPPWARLSWIRPPLIPAWLSIKKRPPPPPEPACSVNEF